MRLLLISALAATLIGCTRFAPQQAQQASLTECTEANGFACSDGAAGTPQPTTAAKKESSRHRRKANAHTKNAKSTIAVKTETPQSSQLDDKSDPVIKKAKATIAAKMENPASVEFVEMRRTDRKNARGNSIDTVCGYVRGKTASGGETGDRPFLYVVQEDEAYIGDIIATTVYDHICN